MFDIEITLYETGLHDNKIDGDVSWNKINSPKPVA